MIKRQSYILILIFFILSSAVFAQKSKTPSHRKIVKKEISTARSNIKRGDKLADAENSMRNLLKDSLNVGNNKIWMTLFDAVKKQYEQLNEKLYLGQQSDTAKFFMHTLHMFDVLESLDSVNTRAGATDKSLMSFRKKHSAYLDQYRTNLFGGGGYYINKHDYRQAYSFFRTYLECAEQPLFNDYDYLHTDKRMVEAAYWAVFCGYKLEMPDIIDKYAPLAMHNPLTDVYIQQYIAESFILKKDTANYVSVLEKGFEKYPDHGYFFSHLVMYYANMGMNDKILDITSRVLTTNPENLTALLARGSALFNLERYDECVKISDKALTLDPNQAVAYLNAGLSYYNRTIPIAKKKTPTKEEKNQLLTLYRRSLPYLSTYRVLKPDDSKVWALPLYNIYLNLNMGDEFEEIENIINQ